MSEYLAMSCDDVEWGGCENHNGGRGRLPLGYVSNRVGESRGTLGGGGMQVVTSLGTVTGNWASSMAMET